MEEKSKIAIYAALSANIGIAVIKFIAAAFTVSSSMLSKGIHSTVDSIKQLLLLLGINKSKKFPDDTHPFGYGQELYFWTLIVAVLIILPEERNGIVPNVVFPTGIDRRDDFAMTNRIDVY